MNSSSYTSLRTKPLYRGTQMLWYILGIVEILLAFRLILKLLGANAEAGFTSFIYATTYIFANPFLTVFKSTQVAVGNVFEWTTLLAMFVYWILITGAVKLLLMSKSVSTSEAAHNLNYQERH
jgi:hypothetical protein